MAKKRVITNTMQKVAADILTSFVIGIWDGITEEKFWETYKEIYEQYELNDDPFTKLPCSNQEYIRNNLEYQRQSMMELYGHCDGLE